MTNPHERRPQDGAGEALGEGFRYGGTLSLLSIVSHDIITCVFRMAGLTLRRYRRARAGSIMRLSAGGIPKHSPGRWERSPSTPVPPGNRRQALTAARRSVYPMVRPAGTERASEPGTRQGQARGGGPRGASQGCASPAVADIQPDIPSPGNRVSRTAAATSAVTPAGI